jgi:hypothetical protein
MALDFPEVVVPSESLHNGYWPLQRPSIHLLACPVSMKRPFELEERRLQPLSDPFSSEVKRAVLSACCVWGVEWRMDLVWSATGDPSMSKEKRNRLLKVAVQGLDFKAHPLYMSRESSKESNILKFYRTEFKIMDCLRFLQYSKICFSMRT